MTLYWTALRQQRLALVVWAVALGLMALITVANAQVLETTDAGAFLAALPEAMRNLVNVDLMLERPLDGFLNAKMLYYMPLLVGIYAAFQAAGMLAREVERRQMDFVLSLPVSRRQLLWSRLRAMWTGVALLWAVTLAVLAAALAQNGLSGDWTGYLLIAWIGMLLNAALGAVAMWISAGASEYRRALRAGLGLTVALFLADMALTIMRAPLPWRRLALYGFYDTSGLLVTHRIPWPETLALLAVTAAAAALAVRTFTRREV